MFVHVKIKTSLRQNIVLVLGQLITNLKEGFIVSSIQAIKQAAGDGSLVWLCEEGRYIKDCVELKKQNYEQNFQVLRDAKL